MARLYPRFLFSNPKNTKSNGPFIVHLLNPRVVFKVIVDKDDLLAFRYGMFDHNESIGVVSLDPVHDENEIRHIAEQGIDWLVSQIKSKQVTL